MALKDRLLTRPVAEAIMSPGGILLAGVGIAGGIIIGLNPVGAVAIGAAAWAARVGAAVPRGPVRERIDRRTVSGTWQRFVDEAIEAQQRFRASVDRTRPGPIRDRLAGLGSRIDEFVRHSYEVAQRGQALSEARAAIDTDAIVRQMHTISGAAAPAPGSSGAQAMAALQAQLGTASRLDETIRSTHDRLLVLDARLDELVTRSIELSVTGVDGGTFDGSLNHVEQELIDVVDEMEAVRQAVTETG